MLVLNKALIRRKNTIETSDIYACKILNSWIFGCLAFLRLDDLSIFLVVLLYILMLFYFICKCTVYLRAYNIVSGVVALNTISTILILPWDINPLTCSRIIHIITCRLKQSHDVSLRFTGRKILKRLVGRIP